MLLMMLPEVKSADAEGLFVRSFGVWFCEYERIGIMASLKQYSMLKRLNQVCMFFTSASHLLHSTAKFVFNISLAFATFQLY